MSTRQRRRAFLRRHLNLDGRRILEIGALHGPTFTKDEAAIAFMDWQSREDSVKALRPAMGAMTDQFVEVDHVVTAKAFDEHVPHGFDLLIGNHLIEHIPDTVRWLRSAAAVLRDGGHVFLAVPDRRYTFDYARPLTTPGEILRNYDNDTHSPELYDVFDMMYLWRPVKTADVWRGEHEPALAHRRFTAAQALDAARKAAAAGYVDVHVHVFEYRHFLELFTGLAELGLCPFTIAASEDVVEPENEFLVLLKKETEAA